jgi:hypothetical protein
MADQEILDAIYRRILEARNQKGELENLDQCEWDRDYLYNIVLEALQDSLKELLLGNFPQNVENNK